MRIFLSCQQALCKHNIPTYSFWETYLKNGIEEAQYQWIESQGVDWAEGLVYSQANKLQQWRDRTWTLTLSSIKQQHKIKPIDLFLSYLFPKQVESGAIQEIKALGIPCVNFFCDNVRDLTQIPKEFYCFDLHWVPEFKALKMYQQARLNYIYAPMPVWIPQQYRIYNHFENYGVSFIGSRDIQREILFAKAIKLGINLEMRGAGWLIENEEEVSQYQQFQQNMWQKINNQRLMINNDGFEYWLRKIKTKFIPKVPNHVFTPHVREKPNFHEYFKIIQQSQITLGVNRYPSFYYPFNRPNTYSRMRDIEAPMLGACYLTEWTEGLDDLYELGEEVETYSSAGEMVEKIQYLQANSEKRKAMRSKSQLRALEKHNISSTLKKIVQELNI